MPRAFTIFYSLILILAGLVTSWFLFNNLTAITSSSLALAITLSIVLALVLASCIKLKNPVTTTLRTLSNSVYFIPLLVVSALVASFAARFFLLSHFSYIPISDPSTFYEAAIKIADGKGMTGDAYAAFFPYLAAYNGLLGAAFSIMGDSWLTVISLNSLLDLVAASAIYATLRVMGKNQKIATFGFILWILSPFSILFSTISIPVSAVNAFVALSVLLCALVFRYVKKGKVTPTLLSAATLGGVLGIGNAFRPVFTIFVIALCITLLYFMLSSKKRTKKPLLSVVVFVLPLLIFLLLQHCTILLVEKATALKPATNASGWSIFVGANKQSLGKWNAEDQAVMENICQDLDYTACHEQLTEAGIERFKSYGAAGSLELMTSKLVILSSDQNNIYNADTSIVNFKTSSAHTFFTAYLSIFFILITLFSSLYLYREAFHKQEKDRHMPLLLISLLLIGLFVSTAFVETSPRYAQVLYPLFTLLATLGITNIGSMCKKR